MAKAKNKGGRLSRETEKFIRDNSNEMTPEEMASKLNIPVKTVNSVIDVYGNLPEQNVAWKQELRRSASWKQIKNQFTDEELDFFEDQYVKLMEQFKEDIVSTERTQVFQLIKIQIMMDRVLESKKRAREQVRLLENAQKQIVDKSGGDFTKVSRDDNDAVAQIGQQIAGFVSAEQQNTREYVDLGKQHNDILKMLKGAREQRVTGVENSKVSFTGLVKLLMDRDFQESESRQNTLFLKATDKEFKRLTEPHRYMDNSIDLPILNAESVENFEKESLAEEEKEKQEQEIEEEVKND